MPTTSATPRIIVHGGAGWIQDHVWPAYQQGTQSAARRGQALLDSGVSAVDAAVAAVIELENNPVFNAGLGSSLNFEGVVENDAFVMDDELNSGAVAALVGVKNPVLAARAVMQQSPHLLLAGDGALRFANAVGLNIAGSEALVTERRREQWQQLKNSGTAFEDSVFLESQAEPGHGPEGLTDTLSDTVGACAIDKWGRIAVASSTGGIMLKLPGRVGDTPLIGSGCYCGPAGAAACTGHGEACMRVVLAKFAYDCLQRGATALEAAQAATAELAARADGRAGLIVLDRAGLRAWSTTTARIAAGVPELLLDSPEGSI